MRADVERVLIDWSADFDRWYDRLIERSESGDRHAVEQVALIEAELDVLQDLEVAPAENAPPLRRISQ